VETHAVQTAISTATAGDV